MSKAEIGDAVIWRLPTCQQTGDEEVLGQPQGLEALTDLQSVHHVTLVSLFLSLRAHNILHGQDCPNANKEKAGNLSYF